ncbi:MAG: DMT family transporter [Aestuariivirga sp.]
MTARSSDSNLTGMISLMTGVMVFSVQDAIIKLLSGDYPVTQAIVLRCLVALPLLVAFVSFETGLAALKSKNIGLLTLRGLILLVAYTTYYMALPALPLAEAVALFFIGPIFITILAGLLLGEKLTAASWIAVFTGFAGVLIIVRPGSALFEPAALLSVASAFTYALAMILARRLGVSEGATVMAFYQNVVYLFAASAMAMIFAAAGATGGVHPSIDFLLRPWVWPTLRDAALMGLCGIIAAAGMSLLTHAYRRAQAKFVTVFEYTGMIWAPLWGFAFFSEIPHLTTIIGTVLIIAAGIYAVRAASPDPN